MQELKDQGLKGQCLQGLMGPLTELDGCKSDRYNWHLSIAPGRRKLIQLNFIIKIFSYLHNNNYYYRGTLSRDGSTW